MPLISFIIPYYNVSKELLRDCIESIANLNLSTEEFEILLVDDGSTLSPKDVICGYDNIRYIRQDNQGAGSARNLGLDNARGQYIQFVDADDKLNSKEYDQCLLLLRDQKPDAIFFNYIRTDEHGISRKCHVINTRTASSGAEFMLQNNLHGSPCFTVFKSETAKGVRFPTDIMNEDEFFIALLTVKSMKVITYPVFAYLYVYRKGSLTNPVNQDRLHRRVADSEALILRLNDFAEQLNGTQLVAMKRRISQLTMDYIYNSITLVHCWPLLQNQILTLKASGLFPLPKRQYTIKYYLFSIISNNRLGLFALFRLLKLR